MSKYLVVLFALVCLMVIPSSVKAQTGYTRQLPGLGTFVQRPPCGSSFDMYFALDTFSLYSCYNHVWTPLAATGGTVGCAGLPGFTGDVTKPAGSCATTVVQAGGTSFDTIKKRDFGATFGDTGGAALTAGSTVYFTVPYACTIAAYNATLDAGTAAFDVWKIATGTAVPTVANTITAAALPTISSGTAIHSTTLTGWNTSVVANDIFGIKLQTVSTAKFAELDLQCNQ
jgi:hypothetical protein